jgi:hypothetical protein
MTWDEDRIAVLLRDAGGEPPRGPRVDLTRAVHEARRRRGRRRVVAAGAAALATVLTAAAVPIFLHSDRKHPPPAVTPPTTCTVSPLPLPKGSDTGSVTGGSVTGGDPTGRWLVGMADDSRQPHQRTAVIWDGDRVTELPGALRNGVLRDVNSAGTAVGDTEGASYVYRDGRVEPLAGAGNPQPRLINDAGTVVGERVFGRNGVGVTVPVRWRTLTSPAVDLPLPGPGWQGWVAGLDEDGTAVGKVSDGFPPSRTRGYLWHPDGTGEFLPVPATAQGNASAFWPVSVRNGWVVGTMGVVTVTMRLNLATGEFTSLPAPAEFYPAVGTARGWAVGHIQKPIGAVRAMLVTDAGVVELPEPKAGPGKWDPMPSAVSDDGRTIAGTHTEWVPGRMPSGVPVRWQCR